MNLAGTAEQPVRAVSRYLRDKDNREVVAYVCGGLAAVVSAGWVFYTHFADKPPETASVSVSAPGGVAAQTINGSAITVGPRPPAELTPERPR